jgi:mRNA-degrading endonuclease RelE of RelBE toxin-antitoxin system
MSDGMKRRTWALTVSPEFQKESKRLPPKYRNQIARKTQDLMNDPTPGGSRTTLKEYSGLCRLRAGEFRIIYAYNDKVVELLSLRRRNESTYDNLDDLEVQQFAEFRSIAGSRPVEHKIHEWEELAKKWAAPQVKAPETLPRPITAAMLDELNVPAAYQPMLLQVKTEDDLLGCDAIPLDTLEQVLECLYPRKNEVLSGDPHPVVVREDLIDVAAAVIAGPIDTETAVAATSGPSSAIGVPTPLILVATRRHQAMSAFIGNASKAIGQDARYTVKLDGTVQLTYALSTGDRALLTTDGHNELVSLVNEAKRHGGSSQDGGSFFINEYRHVLVPTQNSGVLYAGDYTRDLEFVFEDSLISPVARSGIRPGDIWPGPHVGIKYTLAAEAQDVRYELESARGTRQRINLSGFYSPQQLADLLKMFRDVKPRGGAVYINEARELFAPVERGESYERVYIGHLGNKPWFPKPV